MHVGFIGNQHYIRNIHVKRHTSHACQYTQQHGCQYTNTQVKVNVSLTHAHKSNHMRYTQSNIEVDTGGTRKAI